MTEGGEKGFRWGLTPGGNPDPVEPTPAQPEAAPPLDRGHFEAVHSDSAHPAAASKSNTDPAPALGNEDIETQEFATQRAAFVPNPPYESTPPPLTEPPVPDAPPTGLDALSALGLTEPAFPVHPDAGQPPAVDASLPGSADALVAQPLGLPDAATGSNDLDSVFGASRFVEYVDAPLVPGSALQSREPRAPRPPVAPLSPTQKKLALVAVGLVAAIVLVAFYVLGTRIAPEPAPVAKPSPAASASSSPTPVAEPLGPLTPGTYAYNALLGTECVEPFESAWQKEYTVVACSEPHSAQLVARGVLSDAAAEPFPGVDALDARITKRCSSSRSIDYSTVSQLTDLQVEASFAADDAEWAAGNRDWFCFATRASGDKLTANIAMPDVAHLPAAK